MSKEFAAADLTLGQLNAIVKKLGGQEGAMRFLRDDSKVVSNTHTINCNTNPFVPKGWKVEEHQKGGHLQWDAEMVALFLCDEQRYLTIEGNKLRQKLKDKPVLNACVLDYLLDNPQLIPEEWKEKYILFWGTIYRQPDGRLYVRYLIWCDTQWGWLCHYLGSHFDDDYPAALLSK